MKEIRLTNENREKTVAKLLEDKNIFLQADCGGRGTCGKCQVIVNGEPALACKSVVTGEITVEIPESTATRALEGNEITALESFSQVLLENIRENNLIGVEPKKSLEKAICIDIGTTTIAGALVEKETGLLLSTAGITNHQRRFGSDVISRIDASNNGYGEMLQKILEEDIYNLCEILCQKTGLKFEKGDIPLVITGNTTMEHLLLGYSCETLGQYPYTPINIGIQQREEKTILPGISAFVGADIAAGICACGMDKDEKVSLLVDLGTNGEMALGNKDKIMVTSTAAGPAFEGGNISCGMAGVAGAICTVNFENSPKYQTIEDAPAIGICGTGVLEVTGELIKTGLVDKTGLMDEQFFEEGFPLTTNGAVRFTQKDVRQVQMAKAAVRAGIKTLIEEYGIKLENISRLYLAGGFGERVNIKKACEIGLIPAELESKSVAVGNSALAGAIGFYCKKDFGKRLIALSEKAKEITLSDNDLFNVSYINYMNF